MKKTIIVSILLSLTAGIAIHFFNIPVSGLSALCLDNIEALSNEESGNGRKPDFARIVMCGEYMYNPCIDGNPKESCTAPC